MLTVVKKNDKTVKYVKNRKEAAEYIPDGAPGKVMITDGVTQMYYGNDLYEIEDVDKEVGNYAGNVCPVCMSGEMSEFGGCATCNACGAQLKCGL